MPAKVQPISSDETGARRSRDVATTRTSRGSRVRETTGRYDGGASRLLPTGLAKPAFDRPDPSAHNKRMATRSNARLHSVPPAAQATTVAAVVDPMGNGIGRIKATVNRRVDILEAELSHKRISGAAYQTGRLIQAVFERMGTIGGSSWQGTDKKDTALVSDHLAARMVLAAQAVDKLKWRMEAALGGTGARLVRLVLVENVTFERYGAACGPGSERDGRYAARRFREALEDLAEAWSAKGQRTADPDDKHAEAGRAAIARQRAAMEARMAERDSERADV